MCDLFGNDRDENEYRAWLAHNPSGPERRRALAIVAAIMLLFWACVMAAEAWSTEPATVEVPTSWSIAKLKADLSTLGEQIDTHATELAALRAQVQQQSATIAGLRKIAEHPFNRVLSPASIDYTHGQQLAGSATRGYVVYHSQANDYGLKTDLLPAIEKAPFEGFLMLDIEDWIAYPTKVPYYGDASDAEALKYLRGYAKMIRDATPALKAKRIQLGVYEVPTVLWKNYVWARNDPSEPGYQKWLAKQERVLRLAEESDFLPALRDAGGHVCVVGYLPAEWINHKFAARWMDHLIVNVSRELDARNVPHRWLFRAHGGNAELYRVMATRAKGRCDWWEDRTMPNEFATIKTLLEVPK